MLPAFFCTQRIQEHIFFENCFKELQQIAKSQFWRKSRDVLRQGLTPPGGLSARLTGVRHTGNARMKSNDHGHQ